MLCGSIGSVNTWVLNNESSHVIVKRHIPLDCGSANKTSVKDGGNNGDIQNKDEKENLSRLASTLVAVVFIPGLCCVFFLCFKCPFFHVLTRIREKKLIKKKTQNEDMNLFNTDTHGFESVTLQQRYQTKRSQTICCNTVCLCLRVQGGTNDKDESSNKNKAAMKTAISKHSELVELVDLAGVVSTDPKQLQQQQHARPLASQHDDAPMNALSSVATKMSFENTTYDDD